MRYIEFKFKILRWLYLELNTLALKCYNAYWVCLNTMDNDTKSRYTLSKNKGGKDE